ncbi:MAG: hypothetical protein JWP00_2068 [Chloroflexi bacterium]|nr:hypothetical protein [Chloroflexota bacterium]
MESRNYREYELTAGYAVNCGHYDYVNCLISMAEVEWVHEFYFRSKVESHPGHSYVTLWASLPAMSTIRANCRAHQVQDAA